MDSLQHEIAILATRTLTPQGSVASSKAFCMTWLIVSRSDRISAKFLVPVTENWLTKDGLRKNEMFVLPSTFRSVVAANSLVEWL